MKYLIALMFPLLLATSCSRKETPPVAAAPSDAVWVLKLKTSETIYGRDILNKEAIRLNRADHGLAPRFGVIEDPVDGYALVYGLGGAQQAMAQDEVVKEKLNGTYPESRWVVARQ